MGVVLQDHHMISKDIASSDELLQTLAKYNSFDVDSVSNRVYLPASNALAQDLGLSAHNGAPLDTYESGVRDYLKSLVDNNEPLWSAAQSGDRNALSFFANQVNNFDNVLTAAFRAGVIYTNNGALASGVADAANKTFFSNVVGWATDNASLINTVANLRTALGDSTASLFAAFSNGSQINDLLQFGQNASALNSVKNGAIAVATGAVGGCVKTRWF